LSHGHIPGRFRDESLYALCFKENDTDVAYNNFNAHQPIFVIFGTNVAERVC